MPLIQEEVDIYTLPATIMSEPGEQFTIGDLHANAIKLIFMLVKHGVVTGLTQDDYQELVDIYRKPTTDLNKAHLDKFSEILAALNYNQSVMIRLIGDTLADRGSNDWFVLEILKNLHQNKVPYEILISNHDFEFITAYEKREGLHPSRIQYYQACSLTN